jgi:hypothetical protein
MLSTPTLQWLDSKVLLHSSRTPKPGEASNKWLRVKKLPLIMLWLILTGELDLETLSRLNLNSSKLGLRM